MGPPWEIIVGDLRGVIWDTSGGSLGGIQPEAFLQPLPPGGALSWDDPVSLLGNPKEELPCAEL